MVLELKVPRQNGFAGLRAIVPTLAIYLISFSLTAIYWINHHHLVRRIDQADERVLYANLSFLFCLSLLPFFTSYVLEKENDAFSIALYAASMVITGFAFFCFAWQSIAASASREPFGKSTHRHSANIF